MPLIGIRRQFGAFGQTKGADGRYSAFPNAVRFILDPVKVVVRISLINGIVKPPGRLFRSGTFYAPPGG
jgi:hypothetical protein